MLNIVISILIVLCTTYIGWGISNYYKQRIKFYKELNDLINYLINNINFYKDSINLILNKFIIEHKPNLTLTKIINSYMNNSTNFNDIIIKNDEVSMINNIFLHLGKSDSENQIIELKNYSLQVCDVIKNCENDFNKIGRISLKLGILFGLALAVCLI